MFLQNNTPLSYSSKQANVVNAGNLERGESMQSFLKKQKIITELGKGV